MPGKMKVAVLVPDGAADLILEELGGRTPIEAALTPNLDRIASIGVTGTLHTIPDGLQPGSDVANLSLLGYDPREFFSGRGAIEAASLGIDVPEGWTVFRCNLVSTDGEKMLDYSAGHITQDNSEAIINALSSRLDDGNTRFFPGNTYRNILLLKGDFGELRCTPPHDISGRPFGEHLPRGEGSDRVRALMEKAGKVLADLDTNEELERGGHLKVDMIWPWSQGTMVPLEPFKERFGVYGSIISAVDLVIGLGKLAGLKSKAVPGITGYFDTNYRGKGEAAIEVLEEEEFVFVHVEAPDEASHIAATGEKVRAIERFDEMIAGPVLDYLLQSGDDFRLLVSPDHPTFISTRTHDSSPVPFAACGTGIERSGAPCFSEKAGADGGPHFDPASDMMFHLAGVRPWPSR